MKVPPPVDFVDDNPEWTEEDFARARPAHEVLPPEVVSALVRSRDVQASGQAGELVTLNLDTDVIAKFKAAGADWQARMNAVLRDADPWPAGERDAA